MKYVYQFLLSACFFLNVLLCSGQEFLPNPYPDRVILTITEQPATTMAVTWRTDTSLQKGFVEYLVAPDSPDLETTAMHVAVASQLMEVEGVRAHYFSTVLTGLLPKTTYAYRVGNEGAWSEWIHFTTAAEKGDDFTFLYLGDGQNDLRSRWSRVVRAAYGKAPDARFIVHAGDLINRSGVDKEWGEWHDATGFIHRMIPALATPGNHEYTKGEQMQLDKHWRAGFNFPENGPPGLEETAYYVDYQGMRVISLNSQMIITNEDWKQKTHVWLQKVLAESKGKWKVITFHHPILSTAERRDNPEFRADFQPLFEKYGVHLILQGHDHTYGRGTGKAGNTKPVYVVSVSGPKMYEAGNNNWMEKRATKTQLFQVIQIKGSELFYKSYTASGKLFDEFVMTK